MESLDINVDMMLIDQKLKQIAKSSAAHLDVATWRGMVLGVSVCFLIIDITSVIVGIVTACRQLVMFWLMLAMLPSLIVFGVMMLKSNKRALTASQPQFPEITN